jgi:4-amino-4-deoxy-L-arabinose transferase-like glycosyltransferase
MGSKTTGKWRDILDQSYAWALGHANLLTLLALLALTLAHIIQNLYFISQDHVFLFSDGYALRATEVHWSLKEGGLAAYPRFPFPPFVLLITNLFFAIFGISLDAARWSQQLFTVILIPSVFYIGYRVAGRTTGLLAALIAASSPLMLNTSRGYFLDYGQTSLTALAFALLLASDRFSRRSLSIVLGVVVGLAMLAKWSAIIFLVFPLAFLLAPSLWGILGNSRGRLLFAWSVLYLLATASLAYLFINSRMAAANSPTGFVDYLLYVLLPAATFLAGIWGLRRISGKPPEEGSPLARSINFLLTITVAFLLFAAWAIWSADFFIAKIIINANPITSSSNVSKGLLVVLSNHTAFALPLLLGGISVTFLLKDRSLEKLVWPLNLLFVLAVFLWLGAHPAPRYSLALVVCSAVVIARFAATSSQPWVRRGATGFIVLLSTLSLLGWVVPKAPLTEVSRDHWELLLHHHNFGMAILAPERPTPALTWRDRKNRPAWGTEPASQDLRLYEMVQHDMELAAREFARWDSSRILAINQLNLVDIEGWFVPSVSPKDMLLEQAMDLDRTTASLTLGDKILAMTIGEMTGTARADAVFDGTNVPAHLLVVQARQFVVLHGTAMDLTPVANALAEQFGGPPLHSTSWLSELGYGVTLWHFPTTKAEGTNGYLPLIRDLAEPLHWRDVRRSFRGQQ